MKSRQKRIDAPLTLWVLIALIAKGCWIGIGWPEAIALPLILVIHYGRAFLPAPTPEMTAEQANRLRQDVDGMKNDLTRIKLRVGFSPETKKK